MEIEVIKIKSFYGRVSRSGKKLLINIPKGKRNDFVYYSPVRVTSLKEEEDEVLEELGLDNDQEIDLYQAQQIIQDLDDNKTDISFMKSDEIIKLATKLLNEQGGEE